MNHKNDELMLVGSKESFLIRTLMKKLDDAGIKSFYIGAKVDDINSQWDRASVVAVYLDQGSQSVSSVFQFINDRLMETDKKTILIGEKEDIEEAEKFISQKVIAQTFLRPLDNEKFIFAVAENFRKASSEKERKSILIVDDDATYLGLIRGWLRDIYKVSMANSGLQAIKLLGGNHVDLILLDYEMPVVSGPQVLEMLRNDSETSNIPVIFLTGKSDKGSVVKVLALKPEGYLLKTIEKDELLKELDKFFKGR